MKINFDKLFVLQCEVLRPFAPTQEFALLNLLVEDVNEQELEMFGANVVHAFPHMQRLYSGFVSANQNIASVVPFAIPVNDSDSVMQDVLDDSNGGLRLSPELHTILSQAFGRIPYVEPHVDELNFPPERTEPLTLDHIAQSAMTAIRYGLAPIVVRATKDQRDNRYDWTLNCRKLFNHVFSQDTAPRPDKALQQLRAGDEMPDSSFVFYLPKGTGKALSVKAVN